MTDVVSSFLAAVIGGLLALVGAQRALAHTAREMRQQRRADYVAVLRAAAREFRLNADLLESTANVGNIWLPLERFALDRLLIDHRDMSTDTEHLGDLAAAIRVLTQYNTVANLNNAAIAASGTVGYRVAGELVKLRASAPATLRTGASALDAMILSVQSDDRLATIRRNRQKQESSWLRRIYISILEKLGLGEVQKES